MADREPWLLAAILMFQLSVVVGQMRVGEEACDNAFIVDGAGRAAVSGDCTRFIHCDFTDAFQTEAFLMDCPDTLFWNPSTLVCQYPEDVLCPFDRCVGNSNGTYQLETDRCGEYWVCIGERTFEKRCCPFRESYRAGSGCVPDISCEERCPREFIPQNLTGCGIIPHRDDLRRYIQLSTDGRSFDMRCAFGALFDPETCDCSIHDEEFVPFDAPECHPAFMLSFPPDQTFRDFSGYDSDVLNSQTMAALDQDTPSGDRGAAFFDGVESKIISRRFNFAEFGYIPKFNVTFLPDDNGASGDVALLTNNACDQPPSVELFLRPAASTIVGRLLTMIGEVSVESSYSRSSWNTVVMGFDGQSLSLDVNGNVRSSPPTGNPAKVLPIQCSLQIGFGKSMNRFKGHIDEVSVTLC